MRTLGYFGRRLLFAGAFTWATLSGARAELREARSVAELAAWTGPGTLVVFDLDNTTFRPTQTLGSDQFFGYLIELALKRGMKAPAAIDWALRNASEVSPVTPVRPVEAITPAVIASFQSRGLPVIALTARPRAWLADTLRQIREAGVDFARTAPPELALPGGVWFQEKYGDDKGQDLLRLIERMHLKPRRVAFIDDKPANARAVNVALDATPLPHLSLRYGATDDWVRGFEPAVADLEWDYFRRYRVFVSDAAARAILRAGGR